MGRSLALVAALVSFSSMAATLSVPIQGVLSGALDVSGNSVYVVNAKSQVQSVDLETGKLSAPVEGIDRATAITSDANEAIVQSSGVEGAGVTLHRIDLKTKKLVESIVLPTINVGKTLHFVTEDRILVQDSQGAVSHVVSLKEKKVLASLKAISGLLYATPGIALEGGKAFLPGAYPGQIAILDIAATTPTLVVRKPVNDWIHDVKLVDKDTAITAGHLDGVSVVDLNKEVDHSTPPRVLTKSKYAHLVVEGKTVLAISIDKLESFDLSTDEKKTVALPKLVTAFGRSALPLGRDKAKRLVVLVERGGVLALE